MIYGLRFNSKSANFEKIMKKNPVFYPKFGLNMP